MKNVLQALCLFVISIAYAQDQQGYYISSGNKKVSGYFKTTDFSDISSLKFRETPDGIYVTPDAATLTEYVIGDQYKYVKYSVKIDKSNNNSLRKISRVREPEWQDETIFLNVITEGKASLYSYKDNEGVKYFYTVIQNAVPQQLVYKKYSSSGSSVMMNYTYREQLFKDVNCGSKTMAVYIGTDYTKDALQQLFSDYNECSGATAVSYLNKSGNKEIFKIAAYAGTNLTAFSVHNDHSPATPTEYLNSLVIGFEGAFVMPSKKVELFLRVDYEYIVPKDVSNTFVDANTVTDTYKLKFSTINLVLGPRYNFWLNDVNKLSIDAGLGFSRASGHIDYARTYTNGGGTYVSSERLNVNGSIFATLAVGYALNEKFTLDLRYMSNRNYFSNAAASKSIKASSVGITLKYSFN